MKRIIALLLAMMLVLSLAACGGETTDPGTAQNPETPTTPVESQEPQGEETVGNFAPTTGYDGSEVTITFHHTMNANLREVVDNYVAEFNKMYPNITVIHEQVGGYDDVRDQISTKISAGNQPNIAYCYPDHVAIYNMAKAVTTLDELIDSQFECTRADGTTEILGLTEEQKADFIEGYYAEGREFGDGLMYTMPFSKSTEVLYYNKTFFDEHGLTPPTTWEEMEALCAKILEIDPMCYPLGYDSESNWFITMTEQYGSPYTSAEPGNQFLFDNEQNHAFVKMFNSWYQKGYVTTQNIYGGYTSGLFTNMETDTPNSYMSIGSSAGATHQRPAKVDGAYPFDVGITTIPQVDPANPKVISQGPSVCIFQKENEQEVIASWLFVKFLTTSPEFQAEFSMASGYVPVIKSAAANPVYADFMANANGGDQVAALSAKICLDQAHAYYTSPAFDGSSKARDEVGALLTACLTYNGDDVDGFIAEKFQEAFDECDYYAN